VKETRVGRWLIYGLLEENTGCLFYIGKTHKRREHRLREHIEAATEGSPYPVHQHIREILTAGGSPEIFVLERVKPTDSWQAAEILQIQHWRNFCQKSLPVLHRAQTPKSDDVWIRHIDLKNVRDGG